LEASWPAHSVKPGRLLQLEELEDELERLKLQIQQEHNHE
jgi:hypothetical protein